MHGIDLGGYAPCCVLAGNPLICCNQIVSCNKNCQGDSQMVPVEAKTFQT